MDIKSYDNNDTAMLELKEFKLFDIGSNGLNMMLQGESGKRFSDRYEINDLNYSNLSTKKSQAMSASLARYKDNILYLDNNVIYQQGENFIFKSNEAIYNEKNNKASTSGKFELKSADGLFGGAALEYNSETQNVKAKSITAIYHLNKVK